MICCKPISLTRANLCSILNSRLFFLSGRIRNFRRLHGALLDRGVFHSPANGDSVTWAVNQIAAFLHREQDLALDMSKVIVPGQPVHGDLARRPGLLERITQFDPGPIP